MNKKIKILIPIIIFIFIGIIIHLVNEKNQEYKRKAINTYRWMITENINGALKLMTYHWREYPIDLNDLKNNKINFIKNGEIFDYSNFLEKHIDEIEWRWQKYINGINYYGVAWINWKITDYILESCKDEKIWMKCKKYNKHWIIK
jgi:hypothetical protein